MPPLGMNYLPPPPGTIQIHFYHMILIFMIFQSETHSKIPKSFGNLWQCSLPATRFGVHLLHVDALAGLEVTLQAVGQGGLQDEPQLLAQLRSEGGSLALVLRPKLWHRATRGICGVNCFYTHALIIDARLVLGFVLCGGVVPLFLVLYIALC